MDKSKGLYPRYIVRKAEGPQSWKAQYFVLNLNSSDPNHRRACIKAAIKYASEIRKVNSRLANDIMNLIPDRYKRKIKRKRFRNYR